MVMERTTPYSKSPEYRKITASKEYRIVIGARRHVWAMEREAANGSVDKASLCQAMRILEDARLRLLTTPNAR